MAFAMLACLAACSAAPPPPSVRDLMKDQIQPQADIFWNSAGSVSDESGMHDLTPTTDKGWENTRAAAARITGYGNLLMTADYAKDRGEGWIRFAKGMIAVGQRAEQAAADHDGDAVFEIGGALYDVCSACHQAYPQTETPAEDGA